MQNGESGEDGVIWDTEDEPLYEEFQGQGNKIKDI